MKIGDRVIAPSTKGVHGIVVKAGCHTTLVRLVPGGGSTYLELPTSLLAVIHEADAETANMWSKHPDDLSEGNEFVATLFREGKISDMLTPAGSDVACYGEVFASPVTQ